MGIRMSFGAHDVFFFFGAGASAPFGIPTMKQFVTDFEKFLQESGTKDEMILYLDIKESLKNRLKREIDLEDVFTVIDGYINFSFEKLGLLSTYVFSREIEQKGIFPSPTYEADRATCRTLRKEFQNFVRDKCLIPDDAFDKISRVYQDLFNRFVHEFGGETYKPRDNYYHSKWSMFTTNYDTCLEHYWRQVARAKLNTGFTVDEARRTWVLTPLIFERDDLLRLFKLHGSISWLIEPDGTTTEEQSILGRSLVGRRFVGEMMIYPVEQKELYLEPYISMFKPLNHELERKSIWVIIGYSFNDPVIREVFLRNSDERKRIVLVHPSAQEVKYQRLNEIKCKEFHLLDQKFGEHNFKEVNHSIIKCFKPNPRYSPQETPA